MPPDNRPLSPHLQIYRLPLIALTSISHRISGLLLAAGSLVLVWWLIAAASGPDAFASAQTVLGSLPVELLMFLWSFALFYHLCNGIRHLFWDAGYGFELDTSRYSAIAAIAAAGVLTVIAWILALSL